MSLVQISSMPVAVCTGMGPNLDAANNEASKRCRQNRKRKQVLAQNNSPTRMDLN